MIRKLGQSSGLSVELQGKEKRVVCLLSEAPEGVNLGSNATEGGHAW